VDADRNGEPGPDPAFDCRQCGACCRDAADGRVLVGPDDLVRWKREGREDILDALVPGHFGQSAFAARSDGTCAHLGIDGRPGDCAIYATRGQACRAVQPGDAQCLAYRRADPSVDDRRDPTSPGPRRT
jgi:Fe-S-cluster containining protein